MEKTFDIKEELKKLPDAPGVYIMHDRDDVITYIGKAKSLTKRVHQYFQASHNEGIKKKQMVEHIDHFEYIVTDSELEALVLECNLIKEHTPKYNTMLRDDKTYPYIKVTLGEDYPRVLFSRQMKKDKSRYFGPYTSASAVKSSIDLINKIYKLRTCNRRLPRDIGADRPCLNYHIHQCSAPCQGYVTKEEYAIAVKGAIDFLNGDYEQTIKALSDKMLKASESMEFEKAAEYRDLINSVKQVAQKQKITNADGEDKDIIALANDDTDAVVQVFFIRNGKLIGRDLDTVAKALNISLDHHHRAVDDAACTAEIFVKFIEKLKDRGISSLDEVNALAKSSVEMIRKMPTYHAIILATCDQGRTNLYRLISLSHIKYYNKRPRIPKSEFNKYRDGLLIGSACEAGELYRAHQHQFFSSDYRHK